MSNDTGISGHIFSMRESDHKGSPGVIVSIFIPYPYPPYNPDIKPSCKHELWAITAMYDYEVGLAAYNARLNNIYSLGLEGISIIPCNRSLEVPKEIPVPDVLKENNGDLDEQV